MEHKGFVIRGVALSPLACWLEMPYIVNQRRCRRCHLSSSKNGTKNVAERFNLRLDSALKIRLGELATKEGYASVSAFVRQLLAHQVDGEATNRQIGDMEQKTVATINRLSRDVGQLRLQLLATYSLVDSLAKVVLTCLPEPSPQMVEQATAAAKRRYDRLLLSVAQTMKGQGSAMLRELEKNVKI